MVLRLHGYGAWIESDGKPLEEHAVEVDGNVISCYVCSEEGKAFILHFDDDGSNYPVHAAPDSYGRAVDIKIDGSRVALLWGTFKRKITSDGLATDDTVRPYIFAPIDTTDDDEAAAGDDPNNEHIGTIQVKLTRGIKLGTGTAIFSGTAPNTGPIHERSKKAGSHRLALGEAIYKPRPPPVMVNYLDPGPLLTFRFLYRKRDMLKAQGIIPQSPSPSPSPDNSPGPSVKVEGGKNKGKGVKREREDDVIEIASDGDDLNSLQDELKRIQDRIARKKAKRRVKRENVSSTDDVIDLT